MILSAENVEKAMNVWYKILCFYILLMFVGAGINILTVKLNHGKMPVVWVDDYTPLYDDRHCMADENTKLPFLSAWIEIDKNCLLTWPERKISRIDSMENDIIATPGDVLIFLSCWMMVVFYPIFLLFLVILYLTGSANFVLFTGN